MEDFDEEFRKFVETRFLSEFGIENPDIPIQWDDQPFEQPESGMWVAFTYLTNPAKQKSIGKKFVVRTTGYIQIDVVYHPEANLKVAAKKTANFAANIFAFKKFRTSTISMDFSEKHLFPAPGGGVMGRWMIRVNFHFDGTASRPAVEVIGP